MSGRVKKLAIALQGAIQRGVKAEYCYELARQAGHTDDEIREAALIAAVELKPKPIRKVDREAVY